jgi:hypothetical protein
LFGFTGVFVTMMTLPILGQAAALLLGDAENRLGKLARHLPLRYFSAVLGAVVGLGVAWLFFDGGGLFEAAQSREVLVRFMHGLTESAVVTAVLWPCKPWALMITAADFETFAIWLAFCGAVWIVAFELTARIAVDFRELSLETSADVAKRLNRVRRGGVGASGASVSKQALGWRVPWLFGTRAFGAIAWLKLAAMVRKARGTLAVSIVIMSFVTLLFTMLFPRDTTTEVLGGASAIAVLGTLYMCAGLRFDFRADLEHMESIKSWPVGAVAAFVATLLPEVVLVSGLLGVAILSRAAFTAAFHPGLLAIMALQPLVTFAWVALDNAVFLYAPVRYSPGQEGALQHMGRSIVLMLLRIGLLFVSLLCAGIPAGLAYFLFAQVFDVDREPAVWIAGAVAWCGLLVVDVALVYGGGQMLRRFDVARDRV